MGEGLTPLIERGWRGSRALFKLEWFAPTRSGRRERPRIYRETASGAKVERKELARAEVHHIRRVARRMSLIAASAGCCSGPDFCLIFAPCGYDDPEILPT
jgi:hypothetical protein